MSGNLLDEDFVNAVRYGDTKRVIELLNQGADVNHIRKRVTALYHASYSGNIELAELLIMRGANANLGDFTPLGIAASHGYTQMIDLLLKNEADLNQQDVGGYTALHYATHAGRRDSVKKLLEKEGVDCSIQSYFGYTALELGILL